MKTTVTKIICSLIFLLITGYTFAQIPHAFNYQAVARDVSGNVLPNQLLSIRLSLHLGTSTGTIVYSETFAPITNDFGLFTIGVGIGIPVSGQFDTIAWGKNHYYMQVEMDPTGGATYVDMGTSQLLSVPYAMYAENSVWKRNGSKIFYDNGYVGIGINDPLTRLHVLSTIRIDGSSPLIQFRDGATPKGFIQSYGSNSDLIISNTVSSGSVQLWSDNSERMRINAMGNVGVNCTAPAYKFEVDGPSGTFSVSGIRIQNTTASTGWSFYPSNTGDLVIGKTSNLGSFDGTTGAYTAASDGRLKTNIRPLETVLSSVLDMQLKRYEFKENNPLHKESIGIIAQDLQKVFPEFVSVNTANDGNPLVENQMGVDYSGLSIIALKAIQEQQKEIESLKAEIKALKEAIEQLKK
ncbi:MAG TPA: tail fiber domain-containing protein [Bacteroidales bacterium]|nr:tail fiber domain-containing protein [Bacteroidales bacterium]